MSAPLYVARVKRAGRTFEVVIDPEKALEALQKGEGFIQAVRDEEVFLDAEKGLRASHEDLQKAFGTTDFSRIVQIIFTEGDVQLTAEQRKRLREQRYQQVVSEIARMAFDPRSRMPHPPQRIRLALEEAKWHVDEKLSLEKNVELALKALRRVIPISIEKLTFEVRIPAMHVGKAYGIVHQHASVKSEDYTPQGDLVMLIEIPAGLRDELFDSVNRVTHGEAVFTEKRA